MTRTVHVPFIVCPAGGYTQAHRQAGSQAGYRCAQDLESSVVIPSLSHAQCAHDALGAPDGGTVGGSACDRFCFFFACACGAERGHSSSPMVGAVDEVFKIYSLDRIQQRLVEQNSLTFQFRVVGVFKVYAQDRFLLLHPLTHLVLQMSLLKGFFALFPRIKKVRNWVRTRVRGCWPEPAHPRRLLSWRSRPCRTPTSGCSSHSVAAASLFTGTDASLRLPGSRRLASRWFGLELEMRGCPLPLA